MNRGHGVSASYSRSKLYSQLALEYVLPSSSQFTIMLLSSFSLIILLKSPHLHQPGSEDQQIHRNPESNPHNTQQKSISLWHFPLGSDSRNSLLLLQEKRHPRKVKVILVAWARACLSTLLPHSFPETGLWVNFSPANRVHIFMVFYLLDKNTLGLVTFRN